MSPPLFLLPSLGLGGYGYARNYSRYSATASVLATTLCIYLIMLSMCSETFVLATLPKYSPTLGPTPLPTTFAPSYSTMPTLDPTPNPTLNPTFSLKPSPDPTVMPTFSPSASPTATPTASPSPRPTFAPSESYKPTAEPSVAPTPKLTDTKMMVNQSFANIYNMSAEQWTSDSFVVIKDTVVQVLYNYEMCIESVIVSKNVVPSTKVGDGATKPQYYSATVSYTVYYDPAVYDKTADQLYTEMTNTLISSVDKGSFNTILHYEASIQSNQALLNATSKNVSSTFETIVSSNSGSDSEGGKMFHLDEAIGTIFAVLFSLFVTLWWYISKRSRAQRKNAAVTSDSKVGDTTYNAMAANRKQ